MPSRDEEDIRCGEKCYYDVKESLTRRLNREPSDSELMAEARRFSLAGIGFYDAAIRKGRELARLAGRKDESWLGPDAISNGADHAKNKEQVQAH